MVAVVAGIVFCAVVVVGLAWIRRTWMLVTVDGDSMAPAYAHGDRLLARRRAAARIRQGDVAVLDVAQAPESRLIKRVVAVPGDPAPPFLAAHGPRVPAGMFAVLGDNARDSLDSRVLGYIPGDDVLGVVITRRGPQPRPPGSGGSAPPLVDGNRGKYAIDIKHGDRKVRRVAGS